MARITTGVNNFKLPGIPDDRVWRGVSRACKLEPYSYSKIANITWAASKSPMILFTTNKEKGVWARAHIYGWGRGKIVYSVHPDTMSGWHKFLAEGNIDEVLFKLAYHELGHVVANTERQDIGYPPKQWLVDRLQSHYGRPRTALQVVASEVVLLLNDLSWLD